ncbi:hypothetical protein D9M70_431040 [compost metagenome]
MRARNASLQSEAHGLGRQRLDVARQRVIGLVAMHVDGQAALGSDAAERLHRACAILHRPLKMGNAADDIDAHVERTLKRCHAIGRAVVAILREGNELQVDIGRDLLPDLEQRFGRDQPRIRRVHMAADGEKPLADGEIAITQRPLDQRLLGQGWAQLAPERDALKQRAGDVHPWQAERQRCVHVEMRIAEGWAQQPAGGVDLFACGRGKVRLDCGDLSAHNTDINALASVRKVGVADDQVEHGWLLQMSAPLVDQAGMPTIRSSCDRRPATCRIDERRNDGRRYRHGSRYPWQSF